MNNRISAREAEEHLQTNPDVYLVCAYEDDAKCQPYRLDGAISLRELQAKEGRLDKDSELLFYCA